VISIEVVCNLMTEYSQPLADWDRDGCARLAARRAGAVVAPVGGGARRIDEGELELPRAVEVHAIHPDPPLVADELGDLGGKQSGTECEGKEDSANQKIFHGSRGIDRGGWLEWHG